MERDLGTSLDWIAVGGGIAEGGSDVVISRDYISRGLG
jgi:hypothetical protein